jgi:2-dehydro-3-deoxygluconokinase
VREIVVKDGTQPALVIAGGTSTEVPAVRANAVDTTGAGDSFNGGYIASRLAGLNPLAAAVNAHKVAARVVEFHGALAPMDEARKAFEA